MLPRLAPETIEAFILSELDRAGLGHNTFTLDALALIVRSGEGLLRRTKNLCPHRLTPCPGPKNKSRALEKRLGVNRARGG